MTEKESPEGEASPVCYYSNADMSNRQLIPGDYRKFSSCDHISVWAEGGHRTELQAGITSIQSYLSWSPNHIDRDRVTANRDEEKVSSVTIDWAGPGTSIRALVPLSNLATRRKLHQDPPWKSHSERYLPCCCLVILQRDVCLSPWFSLSDLFT